MYGRIVKSERILTMCVCLIMNISAIELPNFIRKYYLLHELLIFKYWRQNISVSNTVIYCSQALRRPEVTLCWRNERKQVT